MPEKRASAAPIDGALFSVTPPLGLPNRVSSFDIARSSTHPRCGQGDEPGQQQGSYGMYEQRGRRTRAVQPAPVEQFLLLVVTKEGSADRPHAGDEGNRRSWIERQHFIGLEQLSGLL